MTIEQWKQDEAARSGQWAGFCARCGHTKRQHMWAKDKQGNDWKEGRCWIKTQTRAAWVFQKCQPDCVKSYCRNCHAMRAIDHSHIPLEWCCEGFMAE